MISYQLGCIVLEVYLKEAKTINFARISTEVKPKQGVVCHKPFSNSNRVSRPNFVKAQIKMDNRLIVFDGVTKILSDWAWLPMPLTQTIPTQVKYF